MNFFESTQVSLCAVVEGVKRVVVPPTTATTRQREPNLPSPTSGGRFASHHRRGGFGRAAPPFISRPGLGPRQRGRQILGQRGAHVDVLAGHGMREGQPRGVQELASQAVLAGRAVLRVAAHRVLDGGQVDPDLVGATGVQDHPQQRRARGACRSISKCVRASRGSSVSIDMSTRSWRWRPIGASIVPVRAGGRPSTSARYSRCSRCAASSALSARCTSSDLATTSSPEVSRSSRCTIPARYGSSPPAARPASAWARVPVRCPRAGCTTRPAGLSTTSRWSSS